MRNILAAGAPPLRLVLRQPNQRAQLARSFRRHQSSKPDRTDPNKVTPDDPPTVVPDAPAPAPLPLWQRLGPLTTAMTAYGRAQRRRPWGTQFVSALVIYCLADLSAQNISSDDPIDPVRNLRSMFIGGLSAIPTYLWFTFLSHNFNYSSHLLSLLVKVTVNQICFAPSFNTYFFGMQALLSGCSVEETIDRLSRTVPRSLITSCQFWPFVQGFSFTFVPIQYRSVFSSSVNIGWQTYLALLNRRAEVPAAVVPAIEPANIAVAQGDKEDE